MTGTTFKGSARSLRIALCAAVLLGCSENREATRELDENSARSTGGAGATGGALGSNPGDAAVPHPECLPGDRLPCACSNGRAGVHECDAGEYADACTDCEAIATRSACSAGRYVGQISMDDYFPVAASACALAPLFGGSNIRAEFSFSLAPEATLDEFYTVTESVSCLDLTVTQIETDEPDNGGRVGGGLSGSLTGGVDCGSGELQGEIRLAYFSGSVCDVEERWWSVKGRMNGLWNEETQAFEGVFDLQEPPTLLGGILGVASGGRGTFWARLDPDAVTPEPVEDCLDGAEWTDFELLP